MAHGRDGAHRDPGLERLVETQPRRKPPLLIQDIDAWFRGKPDVGDPISRDEERFVTLMKKHSGASGTWKNARCTITRTWRLRSCQSVARPANQTTTAVGSTETRFTTRRLQRRREQWAVRAVIPQRASWRGGMRP